MSAADIKTAGPEVSAPRAPDGDGPAPSAPRKSGWANGPLLPYLLIAPAVVAIAAVFVWPLIKTVIMSFQDVGRRELWSGDAADWVGFEQFTNILGDGEFYGNPVDTATLALVDAAGVEAYSQAEIEKGMDGVTVFRTIADEKTGTDAVIVPGWTDGSYPVWLGRAADGAAGCFVVDFMAPDLSDATPVR